MSEYLGEFLVGVLYVAILYALVRPNSPAANVIKIISNTLIAVVGSATGYNDLGALLT